ncbi:hypothetical protein HPULCUR_001933 [Helicostylum pulchrum]|uniref:F-box domain-containing protein n=1 Tax=Helicostylum pulchrum TaxID=562976 RepID=A0ABP9XP59_9FUNG
MKKAMEHWGDFSFEEPKKASFLTLPNSIMEHICRFLDTHDKYVTCFIHPKWTAAAQNVLWEKPCLDQPKNFGLFLTAINESKKNALLVRDIFLIFTDHTRTLFQPIAKWNKERHCPNKLANPNITSTITGICEKVTTLTIYGWELETMHIERLASFAQDLTSLRIVGAKVGHELVLNSVFSRLTSLCLDGNFNISLKWAETLITRATHLTELQISLQKMDIGILAKICTPQRLKLTRLTLTDATILWDPYFLKVVEAFPGLVEFRVEGGLHLTAVSIVNALNSCVNLNCLEIRSCPESLQYRLNNDQLSSFPDMIQTGAYPSRLLIENLNLDDDQLICLSPYLSCIQTMGFKDCPQLTSVGIQRALSQNRYLHIFQVINCPNIDSSILTAFSDMDYISSSLYRIHMESSGPVKPRDVYNICYSGIDCNLREIRLVNYDDLQNIIICSFDTSSEMDRYVNDKSVITLNAIAIDSIAHSTDPQLCPIVEGRFISGQMISLLAENFDMKPHEFTNLMDELEKESTQIPEPISVVATGSLNRLSALRAANSTFRSTTPALWTQEFKPNDIPGIYGLDNRSENTLNVTEEYHTSDAQEDEDEEEEEEEEEDEEEEEEQERISSTLGNTGSEINLGGWGPSSDDWNSNKHRQQRRENVIIPSAAVETSTLETYPEHDWNGYVEGDYKEQWQQSSFFPNKPNPLFKRDSQKHYRNSPIVSESDGWGPADKVKVVDWHDVEKQGFVKEVLDEQRNTSYWVNEKYTSGLEHEKTVQTSGANTPALTASPPIPFSSFTNGSSSRYNSKKVHSDRRSRSDSLVSSDSGISWTDSTENVIKLSTKEPALPKFSVVRKSKPEKPRYKWSSAEEWGNTKESEPALATPTPITQKHSTWQDNFAPEVLADKNAKGDWATGRTAAPRRSTFSRPPTSSANKHTVGNWGEFANNPGPVPQATTTTATTISTTTNATNTNDSISLIDTTNSPNVPSRPVLKGDVWESIGTLEIPDHNSYTTSSSKVLVPQEASASRIMPVEVLSYSNGDANYAFESNVDSSSLVRFSELISGTVSNAEIEIQKQASEADNLVDFGDLIPLNNSNNSPRTSPITHSQKRDTLVINSNNSVDFNLSLVQPLPKKENEPLDADKYKETAFDSINREMNLASSMKNAMFSNNDTGNISRANSPISQKSDTFFSVNSASRTESPQLAVPTLPITPIASTAPTTPTAATTPTFEEKEGSSSETEKKTMKPIRLRVKRSDDSFVNLSLYDVSFE